MLAAVGVASAAGSLLTLPLWTALFTLGAFAAVVAVLLRSRRLALALIALAFVGGGTVALLLKGSSKDPASRPTSSASDSRGPPESARLAGMERKIDALIEQLAVEAADTTVPLRDLRPLRAAILEYLNRLRDRQGLQALDRSDVLERAAQSHVADMLEHDEFDHVGSKGDTFRDRAGAGWKPLSEAIAFRVNPTSWVSLLKDLQASPVHRKLLVSPASTRAGVGIDFGSFQGSESTVITLVIGARR